MNGLLGVFLGNANLGSQRRFSAASFGICLYVFMVAGWKIPGRNGAFNGQIIKLNGLFSTKPCLTPPPAGEKSRHRRPVLLPFTTTEAYKFRLGDVNFHQSCRLKAKVYRPMSSLAGRQLSRQKLGFSVGVCWENRGWKPWSCQAFFFLVSSRLSLYFCCQFQVSPRESRSENKGLRYRACWPESSSFQRGNG